MRYLPLDDVVLRVMSVRERAYLATLAVATRRTAFFRCWVRKEAVVKALGTGFKGDKRHNMMTKKRTLCRIEVCKVVMARAIDM